jgi:hypothetical protein
MNPLIGAALTGLGGAAGGPLGAAAGTALANVIDPQARAYQKQLKKDTEALQQGNLGYSEAQKRSMLAGTQRALQAQTAGVEANLRRQAAAAGGFGRSGAQTNALTGLARQQNEQVTQAAGNIDAMSQQQAQQRYNDIMGRLAQQRQEARETGALAGKGLAVGASEAGGAYVPIRDAERLLQAGNAQELQTMSQSTDPRVRAAALSALSRMGNK